MQHGLSAFWDFVLAPYIDQARPQNTFITAGGDGGLVRAVLRLTEPWGGAIHLADRAPAFDVAPARQAGDRFTLHRARARDAAKLLPLPDLVLLDGASTWQDVTGLLHTVAAQAARQAMPFPVTLAGHVAGPAARQDFPACDQGGAATSAGPDPRAGVLTALEDFVADQAAALTFALLPVLDGLAVVTARAVTGRDAVRTLLGGIAMGPAALRAVAVAEQERTALAAENATLRADGEAAAYCNGKLHEALRAAQSAAEKPPPPHVAAARAARRLMRVDFLRRPGRGKPDTPAEIDIACLRASPILDVAWYLARYPDVAASGEDAAAHYYHHGAAEGRDPGPAFATGFYLAHHPRIGGANPVLHYLREGAGEGCNPSPDFDTRFYLERYPDVAAAGINPLEHYLATGRAEGRQTKR